MATIIGALGEIVFSVSADQVLTFQRMMWNSSANYSEHGRHLGDPKLEYTGMEADTVSLQIRLSALQGVRPMEQITKLFEYERSGAALPLVIGTKGYGKFRWVITSTSREMETFDNQGNLVAAVVTLEMKGYTR